MIIVKIKDGNIVCKVQNRISVKIYGAFIATSSTLAFLNSLSSFVDDVAAGIGGVAVGGWYILADGTDIGLAGTLKKRLS